MPYKRVRVWIKVMAGIEILPSELVPISLLFSFHVLPISPFLFIPIFWVFFLVLFTIFQHLLILFTAPLEEFFEVWGCSVSLVVLPLLPGVIICLSVALLSVILVSIFVTIECAALRVEGVSTLVLLLLSSLVLPGATKILLSILSALPCTIIVSFDPFISQNTICISNVFEPFLSFPGIFVRVILLSQLIICLFDVALICCLRNTEYFVVVLLLVEIRKTGKVSSVDTY